MPGNYSHTTRADGTTLTATIYNADHQNHITNQTPAGTDDYQADATQKGLQTDPAGGLATSLATELEHLRYILAKLANRTNWYDTPGPLQPAVVFRVTGAAAVATKVDQALVAFTGTIKEVKVYSDVAPTGADLIIDLNKNGTTIWTTQANRAKVVAGANAGSQTTFDVTAVAAGDRLTLDVDQVGSGTTGGNDLLVVVLFK